MVAPPSQSLADEVSKVKSLWEPMREEFTKVRVALPGGVGTVGLDVFFWGCFMVVLFRVGTWDLEMWYRFLGEVFEVKVSVVFCVFA